MPDASRVVDVLHGTPAMPTYAKRPSVLFVDDDGALRRVLARCLRSRYECLDVGTASEATDLVRARGIDVVIVDLRLPDRPGLDWIAELRAQRADLVVIVLTGYCSQDDAHRAIAMGAAVLLKPCAMPDLYAAVERGLAMRDAMALERTA